MTRPTPPKKPTPPLNRHIKNSLSASGFCCECGSTTESKYIFFGEKKCIHPDCGAINND